ncbi:jerky protein homolog-like [Colletes gigas]|uniref:jerky protein homolog-like n=1 Tax=Colletes gigas TaxID=935657 RepID=UPI001C9B41C7|nr:jerky protein homolog-like [Colletes gigas]
MNTELFKAWYLSDFIPAVKRHQETTGNKGKVLLLLDNAPSHSVAELNTLTDEMFRVIFFPANVTSLIQPMDQGVIEKTKRLYRKNLLTKILLEENQNVVQFVKHITLKDCCNIINETWISLTRDNLRNAWRKLLRDNEVEVPERRSRDDEEEILNIHQVARTIPCYTDNEIEDTNEWLGRDKNDHGFQILTDEELVDKFTGHNATTDGIEEVIDDEESEESEESQLAINEEVPTDADALAAFKTAIKWFKAQPESNIAKCELKCLQNLKELACSKIANG